MYLRIRDLNGTKNTAPIFFVAFDLTSLVISLEFTVDSRVRSNKSSGSLQRQEPERLYEKIRIILGRKKKDSM